MAFPSYGICQSTVSSVINYTNPGSLGEVYLDPVDNLVEFRPFVNLATCTGFTFSTVAILARFRTTVPVLILHISLVQKQI